MSLRHQVNVVVYVHACMYMPAALKVGVDYLVEHVISESSVQLAPAHDDTLVCLTVATGPDLAQMALT
jgi:hypothetical protein